MWETLQGRDKEDEILALYMYNFAINIKTPTPTLLRIRIHPSFRVLTYILKGKGANYLSQLSCDWSVGIK